MQWPKLILRVFNARKAYFRVLLCYLMTYPIYAASGKLAQIFSPPMVDSRWPCYLLTRKDSNVFLQEWAFFVKKGALFT